MTKAQWMEFTKARASMYRFLGGFYLLETDEAQLKALKQIRFPEVNGMEDSDMDLREGYQMFSQYVKDLTAEDLDDLAADYAKTFLAAGDAAGYAAFPYESVYVDKKHQIGGSTAMKMKALYLDRGFEPDPSMYRTMDDNIGLILEYMAILCEETLSAAEANDTETGRALLAEQKTFVKEHIANWVFSFTSDIMKFAQTPFYKSIAKITNGFIKKETEYLKGGGLWDIV